MGRIITLDLELEPLLSQIAQKAAEIIKASRCTRSLCGLPVRYREKAVIGGSLFAWAISEPVGEFEGPSEASESLGAL